jgi:serine phosphatase RsbU (regulator of sigma subunit)
MSGDAVRVPDRADGLEITSTSVVDALQRSLRQAQRERDLAEVELARAQLHLEMSERLGRVGSWVRDGSWGSASWSPELFRIMGMDPAGGTPAPQAVFERVHPDDLPLLLDVVSRVAEAEDGTFAVEVRLVPAPDDVMPTTVRMEWVVEAARGDRPLLAYGTVRDVTHERRLEEERRVAEDELRRRADRDRRIAGVLQQGLAPTVPGRVGPLRVAARYQPAGEGDVVGGDWHDVFALPAGRIGIVVGDVAGHGIESAVTMARLRHAVRILATSGASPAGVIRRLNDSLDEASLEDANLATVVHAQLDPRTMVLRYCSAGHLPMIVVAPPDGQARRAAYPVPALGGPPIGVITGYGYEEHTVALEPGSLLVGYTDGLIERRGTSLDEQLLQLITGISGLPAAVSSDAEALADALLGLAPAGPREDDTAVLVLAGLSTRRSAVLQPGADQLPL